MEQISQGQQVIERPLQVDDYCRFVDAWLLKSLGYAKDFLYYANTKWKVVSKIPSWSSKESGCVEYYFDLVNEQGVTISSIADEVLIKV